jgi:hypothetical protein
MEQFDVIILDYFFSPIGWARERWNQKFYRETLPSFVTQNRLKANGVVWLPNLRCVSESLERHEDLLNQYYTWEFVHDPNKNPLFEATGNCEEELMKMPDMLTNETQVSADKGYGTFPFYALRKKSRKRVPPDDEEEEEDDDSSNSGARSGGSVSTGSALVAALEPPPSSSSSSLSSAQSTQQSLSEGRTGSTSSITTSGSDNHDGGGGVKKSRTS